MHLQNMELALQCFMLCITVYLCIIEFHVKIFSSQVTSVEDSNDVAFQTGTLFKCTVMLIAICHLSFLLFFLQYSKVIPLPSFELLTCTKPQFRRGQRAKPFQQKKNKKKRLNPFSVKGLQDFRNSQTKIGIKRMGKVDPQPFKDACMKKFCGDWELNSTELCSLWQNLITNPEWYPFKRELRDGKYQEFVNSDDIMLKQLRSGEIHSSRTLELQREKKSQPKRSS
ncbi:hypothetical protein CRYUN_Cryun01aG0043800 [Craigia yunnanensis]